MIMAIFFMILMATLMAAMLASTTETAKRTTDDYVIEQAQLLAKSAVEVAMLRISAYDRTAIPGAPCLLSFNMQYPETNPKLFDISVSMNYFGFGDACAPLFPVSGTVGSISNIKTAESNGTVMIDVVVSNNQAGLILTEPIRYHRRTLQKL